jgi:hypothetical protein
MASCENTSSSPPPTTDDTSATDDISTNTRQTPSAEDFVSNSFNLPLDEDDGKTALE